MTEIIFLVESDLEGGYIAQALGESIITQAEDLESLKTEVRDAVHCHFPNQSPRATAICFQMLGKRIPPSPPSKRGDKN